MPGKPWDALKKCYKKSGKPRILFNIHSINIFYGVTIIC